MFHNSRKGGWEKTSDWREIGCHSCFYLMKDAVDYCD